MLLLFAGRYPAPTLGVYSIAGSKYNIVVKGIIDYRRIYLNNRRIIRDTVKNMKSEENVEEKEIS